MNPFRVEHLARRIGKALNGSMRQLGAYQVLPLPGAEALCAGLVLARSAGRPLDNRSLAEILRIAASMANRVVREGERQRALRENLSAVQSLRRAAEHRDAKSIRVRHDLKAPLVSMRGYLDMLLRGMAGPLTGKAQQYLQRLRQSIEQLRALIDSQLDDGPEPLAPVDVARLLRVCVARVAQRAGTRGIALEGEPQHAPAWARGNEAQLELLLRSFLRICLRPAAKGSRISARLYEMGDWTVIELRSSATWQPEMAEFRICQEIVRRHRGQLFVNDGIGAVVEVRLPRQRDVERWLRFGHYLRSRFDLPGYIEPPELAE
jgi:signal transduction histidine kinase